MADSLWMRLRDTPWDQYNCAPGTTKKVPKMLENLSSRKLPRAMKAAHELWSALCSGGVHEAAVPCTPFLIEILEISAPGVQCEILDILLRISQPSDHTDQIRTTIQQNTYRIRPLTKSQDVALADKAQELIKQLD